MTCELVRQLIREWARTRERPFPYLQVGAHLTTCTSCLSWSTGIAYQPADHYARSLRLRLSRLLNYLGCSLLAVWSGNQDVKIRFCVDPEGLPETRARALEFLARYESFNDETRREGERVRQMVAHTGRDSVLAVLEPYELVRYFFRTALQLTRLTGERLDLLVNLGIVENYQAQSERKAGHESAAGIHFNEAREYLNRVIAVDERRYRARSGTESEKTALVSARINLAGTEVQQGSYSEVALHKAVNLLFEARRMAIDLGLAETDFTSIFSNLMISYLRLYLDHGISEGFAQARALAEEACGSADLGPVLLRECVLENADPELTRLLQQPRVSALASFLHAQASNLPPPA